MMSIKYGERVIEYDLSFSRRKTLTITVHPDGSVVVKAPEKVTFLEVEQRLKKKSKWIAKHQDYFESFQKRTTPRQFVSGETHYYLGRRYRLKVVKDKNQRVVATRGCLVVHCVDKDPDRIKNLVENWYRKRAVEQFMRSLNKCYENFSKISPKKPELNIRKMKRRWGSYSSKGNITLNLELIKVPKDCIDYVVTHELCHIKHKNHGKEFYKLLSEVMPEWEKYKFKLESTITL